MGSHGYKKETARGWNATGRSDRRLPEIPPRTPAYSSSLDEPYPEP